MMTVIFWVGLLIALAIGFDWEGDDGMVVAGMVYALGYHVYRMGRKLSALEKKMAGLEILWGHQRMGNPEKDADVEKREGLVPGSFDSDEGPLGDDLYPPRNSEGPPPLPDECVDEHDSPSTLEPAVVTSGSSGQRVETARSVSGVEQTIREFFTTGNVVVKIGWVILFFGVGFLLKFASDRNMFPVEIRYIAVVAGAMALLWFGWVLRIKNKGYALVLQGGSIGLLYMTVFSASKIHHLIPLGFAGFILVGLVVFSGMLAVVQNARMTAFFGAAGGFLAPVLTSTGSGSHVMLFSYYALLNCGILGIAWFKSWRELNLIGFIFTFGIGSLWGVKAYGPEFFGSTEPFLILFFLFFFMISVLFAIKQPDDRKGYVDGTLVFGLPVIGFSLQGYLVKNMDYGLPVSAVTLSLFYLTAAKILWGKKSERMRTMIESFLSLGVVFGSLALPLSLDGRWTAAAWAMEGAALIWIGVRQHRLKARIFGLLLQAGAGISFLLVMDTPPRPIPVVNGFYLGCLAVSLSGLFSSYLLQKNRDTLRSWEHGLHWPAMIWGLMWWCGSAAGEVRNHVTLPYHMTAFVFLAGLTAGIMLGVYGKLKWKALKYPLFCLSGVLFLMLFSGWLYMAYLNPHPFAHFGWCAWIFSLGVLYLSLYRHESDLSIFWIDMQHLAGYVLVLALACLEADYAMSLLTGAGSVWARIVWGFVPMLFMMSIWVAGHSVPWPLSRYELKYKTVYQIPIMVFLLFWFLIMGWNEPGTTSPVPFIPVFNPVEIVQLLYILGMLYWMRMMFWAEMGVNPVVQHRYGATVSGALGFIWMNTVIGRSVHVFAATPFDWTVIWESMVFQASISVLWTLIALLCMIMARKIQNRALWFTGACLLGVVVLKLFVIDLSNSRAIARIVSFLVTGILMLVVGFLSPLPPRPEKENDKECT